MNLLGGVATAVLIFTAAAVGQAGKVGSRGGASSLPLAAGAVPPDAASALLQMAGQAGVIFAGRVEAVSRADGAGFVDVTFRIEQAVRGCGTATTYVLREWAGLWSGQGERYRVGDRRLMLLAARGVSGMSAPVGGRDGSIPLVAMGTEPLADASGKAPADDGKAADAVASTGVDMRWIAARVLRGSMARNGPKRALGVTVVGEPGAGGEAAGDAAGAWSGPAAPLNKIKGVNGGAATSPVGLGFVLTLLRGANGAS